MIGYAQYSVKYAREGDCTRKVLFLFALRLGQGDGLVRTGA